MAREAPPSVALVNPGRRRARFADVQADQAANKRGNEARGLLAQLLSRGLLTDADYHDDEKERDEDGHRQNEKEEGSEHQVQLLQRSRGAEEALAVRGGQSLE